MSDTSPLSWNDILEATKSAPSSPSSHSSTNKPSTCYSGWRSCDLDVSDFGPSALDDDISLLKCSRCGKVVLKEAAEFHKSEFSRLPSRSSSGSWRDQEMQAARIAGSKDWIGIQKKQATK